MSRVNYHQQQFCSFEMNPVEIIASTQNQLPNHEILFSIQKKVKFGQAIYVCGSTPKLGLWNLGEALRLTWNQNNFWTGEVSLCPELPTSVEYKYVIANWDDPVSSGSQWQIGNHNRKADLSHLNPFTSCQDKWNVDKISIFLLAKKGNPLQQSQYYLVGNLIQLGCWKIKKEMSKSFNSVTQSTYSGQQEIFQLNDLEYEVWTYSFEIFRLQEIFYYYYLRKTDRLESQRKPGRIFKFNHQNAKYPCRQKTINPKGQIAIIDQSSINELKFSKITQHIYVGSYPKTSSDLEKLKSHDINTILSIQSQKDFDRHGLSPYYMKLLCQEKNIKYRRCSIEDMNNPDFIQNAQEGVNIMEETLSSGRNIYVHCSAGIYRSPQMIALYLISVEKYKLQDALSLLEEKHSYARPSSTVIEEALNIMESNNFSRRVWA